MLLKGLDASVVALALSLPVALGATPARVDTGLRVDLKVLLISADGTELGYGAWKAALEREGVPYETATNIAARASRMTPGDVDRAIAWSRARALRLDMAFNGGSTLAGSGDPLTGTRQITDNLTWAREQEFGGRG